jgi:HK97 family phage major capsid protein
MFGSGWGDAMNRRTVQPGVTPGKDAGRGIAGKKSGRSVMLASLHPGRTHRATTLELFLCARQETKSGTRSEPEKIMDPVLQAIESQNAAFAQFKARNDAKIAELERALETSEAKRTNRPGNGGVENHSAGDIVTHGNRSAHGLIDSSAPEVKAFRSYMVSGDARDLKSMDIGTPGDGGYAVPKQISASIASILLRYSPMRQLSTVEQAYTGDYHKIISDPRSLASGWVGEQAARPATATPTFYDVVPPGGDIYAFPMITQQALDDVFFNAEQYLVDAVSQEFLRAEGAAFVNGNGTNQPKGFLQYTAVATGDDTRAYNQIQYIPSGAASAFLTVSATVSPFDVLQTTLFSMKPQYRKFASWLCNSATLSLLATIKDTTGRFVLVPNQVVGSPPSLLGLPILEDPNMPAIATNSFPIALIAPQAYLIVDRMPLRSLRDPYTNRPFIGFYTVKRLYGGLLLGEAIKLVKMAVS